MSNFVVSARKYRPNKFEDVVGQGHVSQTLKNALRNDHLAHAFLFCGPRGVGKTTCARILAKVLNCQNSAETFEPCNHCDSCKAFSENSSFNITELDAASNNSVEHIRALIEQVRFQPQQGKYKVFIIDEVHMLSQQAFNAFLKTLEEPPPYAIFILATTEKHKIIPTILSRCQIFDFKRIQVEDMVKHLSYICAEEGIEADVDALNIIAQKADGALRDSLSIFDRIVSFSGKKIQYEDVISNLNILDYDYYFKLVDALIVEDVSNVLLIFDDILRKGFDADLFVNGLAGHIRNLLVSKDTETLKLLEGGESLRTRYQEQAQLIPTAFLLSALNLCNDCDINYKMARNKRLHVEMTLIKMSYINRMLNADQMSVSSPEKKTPEVSKTVEKTPEPAAVPSKEKEPSEAETPKAPVPAAKPEPPIERPKISSSKKYNEQKIDLQAMMAEVQQDAQKQEEPTVELNLENVQQAWEGYPNVTSESLKASMKAAELSVAGDTITVRIGTELAKNNIRQETSLMDYLRSYFSKQSLILQIEIDKSKVVEAPKRQKPLTPKEKYLKMAASNALVHEIRKRFDLRPDEN